MHLVFFGAFKFIHFSNTASAQVVKCPKGKFGKNCGYDCHCLNDCSNVGCEDYQCDNGYFDPPECQQSTSFKIFNRNLSLSRIVS